MLIFVHFIGVSGKEGVSLIVKGLGEWIDRGWSFFEYCFTEIYNYF